MSYNLLNDGNSIPTFPSNTCSPKNRFLQTQKCYAMADLNKPESQIRAAISIPIIAVSALLCTTITIMLFRQFEFGTYTILANRQQLMQSSKRYRQGRKFILDAI